MTEIFLSPPLDWEIDSQKDIIINFFGSSEVYWDESGRVSWSEPIFKALLQSYVADAQKAFANMNILKQVNPTLIKKVWSDVHNALSINILTMMNERIPHLLKWQLSDLGFQDADDQVYLQKTMKWIKECLIFPLKWISQDDVKLQLYALCYCIPRYMKCLVGLQELYKLPELSDETVMKYGKKQMAYFQRCIKQFLDWVKQQGLDYLNFEGLWYYVERTLYEETNLFKTPTQYTRFIDMLVRTGLEIMKMPTESSLGSVARSFRMRKGDWNLDDLGVEKAGKARNIHEVVAKIARENAYMLE